jgi:hypothetical protein
MHVHGDGQPGVPVVPRPRGAGPVGRRVHELRRSPAPNAQVPTGSPAHLLVATETWSDVAERRHPAIDLHLLKSFRRPLSTTLLSGRAEVSRAGTSGVGPLVMMSRPPARNAVRSLAFARHAHLLERRGPEESPQERHGVVVRHHLAHVRAAGTRRLADEGMRTGSRKWGVGPFIAGRRPQSWLPCSRPSTPSGPRLV